MHGMDGRARIFALCGLLAACGGEVDATTETDAEETAGTTDATDGWNTDGTVGATDSDSEGTSGPESCPTVTEVFALDEQTPLGVSAAEVLEYAADYSSGEFEHADGATTGVSMTASYSGGLIEATYSVAQEGCVASADLLRIAAELSFATDDGAFAETVEVELRLALNTPSVWVMGQLDVQDVQGSYERPAEFDYDTYDPIVIEFNAWFGPRGECFVVDPEDPMPEQPNDDCSGVLQGLAAIKDQSCDARGCPGSHAVFHVGLVRLDGP